MLSTTASRTSWKLLRNESISICLMTLLIVPLSVARFPSPLCRLCPLGRLKRPKGHKRHKGEGKWKLHGDRDSRSHGSCNSDRLHIMAFNASRLGGADLLDERGDVGGQLVVVEADLADAGVNITALVGAILDLAGLLFAHCLGHVLAGGDDGAGLGCRHEAAR